MARTPKKIGQTALATTNTAIVTGVTAGRTQITNLWLTNTNTTTIRRVKLMAHGTTVTNTLVYEIEIPAKGTKIFTKDELAIVLTGNTDILYGSQDVGTDVIATAYGIEEV